MRRSVPAERAAPPNIFLCGLSGAGKSSVAPILARLRGARVLDTDAMIVAEAGRPIAQIFAREGETGFREREARAVAEACKQENVIVALGGGAIENRDSLKKILDSGMLVFLDAPVEVLEHRLRRGRGEVRPLLAEPGALARLRERRMPLYERADLVIDAGNLSPQGIAVRIHGTLEGRTGRAIG
jgi:shikimate kinase